MSESVYRLSRIGSRVAMGGYLAICGAAFVGGLLEDSSAAAALGGLGLVGYAVAGLANRRWLRLQYELEWSDAPRMQKAWVKRWAHLTPSARRKSYYRYLHGCVLACSRQWAEAMTILVELSKPGVSPHLTQRAHTASLRCMIELGRAQEVITLARTALASPRMSPRARGALLCVLGLAQLRERQYESALATLDEVTTRPAYRGQRAACSFHRGEALRALGRDGEASAAFARAERLAPKSYAAELAHRPAASSRPPIFYN